MVRCIKVHRIKWIGHIVRMDEERTVKRITVWRLVTVRRIGRQKLRWEDDVSEDLGKMKIWNWSKMDREAWKRVFEQSTTHKEL